MLRLLMVGAGGIGGYFAAKLLEAGHQVVLTARGEHLRAINENGLSVHYQGRELAHQPEALDHHQLAIRYKPDDFDVIVVALKATATALVCDELGDWLKQGQSPVLSLQNGVDNEQILSEAIGDQRVIGGLAVRIGGHIVSPGIIQAEGAAEIVLGVWPKINDDPDGRALMIEMLTTAFNAAGIPTRISDDIRYELWRKLVINNGVNPLSALTGLDTRSLTHQPEFSKIVYGAMSETVAASKADGVNLSRKDLDEMFDLISSFNAIKTSMLVDKEKGRPLELDSISGAVLWRCEHLGIEAPYTATMHALLMQNA